MPAATAYDLAVDPIDLGFGILGGLTPMVAVYTINRSHDDRSPAFLLMAAAAVSSIVIAGLRETYKLALASPAGLSTTAASAGEGDVPLRVEIRSAGITG